MIGRSQLDLSKLDTLWYILILLKIKSWQSIFINVAIKSYETIWLKQEANIDIIIILLALTADVAVLTGFFHYKNEINACIHEHKTKQIQEKVRSITLNLPMLVVPFITFRCTGIDILISFKVIIMHFQTYKTLKTQSIEIYKLFY